MALLRQRLELLGEKDLNQDLELCSNRLYSKSKIKLAMVVLGERSSSDNKKSPSDRDLEI